MKIESMDAKIVQQSNSQGVNTGNVKKDSVDDEKKVEEQPVKAVKYGEYNKNDLTVGEKTIIDSIEKANKAITGSNRKFEFSIHEKTKAIVVKVIDTDRNEVIREIPSENILDMVASMWKMAGIGYDKKG
jgi:flagellar protein FlaG